MNIGAMKHRVDIKKPPSTQDAYGQLVDINTEDYIDVFTNVWASVEPLIGKEYFAAEQVKSEVSVKVRIRYKPGIDSTMVVFYGDRKFQIVSPPIDYKEQHKELVLMCKELV